MTVDIDRIKEWVSGWNADALLADGFEDAIVGVSERIGRDPIVVYDKDKCIEILVEMMESDETDDDPYTTAVEYFEFNVIGSWVGEGTPEFITFWDSEASE